jgi:Cu(I)/Ag(I) efflux system membrane fusion protein
VLGNKTFQGKVVSVDRVINSETRTAKVRILIQDTKINLRPESYLDVTILSPLGEQVVVPFDAILDTGKEAWVFVVKDQGQFEPRLITILERAGDEVAISSGVTPGEKIVTSANFLIDSESRLKGVGIEEKPKTPSCPKGQFWHQQMNHCMDIP